MAHTLRRRTALVTATAVLGLVAWRAAHRAPPPSAPDDATVAAGRAIYRRGESPTRRAITAVLAPGEAPVPAAVMPCVGCHGKAGRGRPEGGVVPADLTPEVLDVPRRATVDRRGRPAYTTALLKRAITMGFDAGGRPLAPTMPRFQMSLDELAALVAYLPRLGHEPEPGVSDDEIRIAVVGSPAATNAARAYFDTVARAGGIYRRSIVVSREGEPVFAGIGEAPDRAPQVERDDDTPWIDGAPPRGAAPTRVAFHLLPRMRELDEATVVRAAARVLVEALRACGRELTQDQLVQALETVHRFDAGVGAPLSFSRGQHIGVAAE